MPVVDEGWADYGQGMRAWTAGVLIVGVLGSTGTAHAAARDAPTAFELGMGAQATLGFGHVCRRELSEWSRPC